MADNDMYLRNRQLRVIHACEKGATGVYWGHRWVASLFFCDLVKPLSDMHEHEVQHFAVFASLIKHRGIRTVQLPLLWCAGGIVYGFVTALGGRHAVWTSTATIETIVERELLAAARLFKEGDPKVYEAIQAILLDELAHKQLAQTHTHGQAGLVAKRGTFVARLAEISATVAKRLAQLL